jgi:hypothetical protein
MARSNPGHRAKVKKKQAQKQLELEARIKEGNLRHDLQYGSNPEIIKYYKTYIQGTGMRQSK